MPQKYQARHEDWRKNMRVSVQEKMVVVFGEFILMEPGSGKSA